jgi:ATP-binding cassette subfamily B protein
LAWIGLEAEEYDRKYKDMDLFRRLLDYFLPHRRSLAIVVIFLTLSSLSNAIVPILSRTIIENLQSTKDVFYLFMVIIITFFLNILAFIFNYFQQKHAAIVIGDVIMNLRKDADVAILSRDLSFFDRNPIGKIVSRMNSDSDEFADAAYLFIQFLSSILIIIILFIYMLTIDIILMLAFSAAVPIFFIVAIIYRRIARRSTLLGQRALARVNSFVQETLSGIQVAKTFRQEPKLYEKFLKINTQAYRVNLRRGVILNFIFPSLSIVQGLTLGLLIYLGGGAVLGGRLNAGDMYLFLQSLWLLFFPLFTIASFWPQFQAGLSSAERIFAIIDAPPAIVQKNDLKIEKLKGHLIFKELTFAYGKKNKVFDNFSFEIRPGESIAIVGHTGAGKSTLAKILNRFYEFQGGNILIDGISIRDFDLKAYRKSIGFIPQVPFLWGDTIENNVKYGKPDATTDEVLWALNNAGGSVWIDELGNGLQTMVGERGKLLSMGQRQLIAFARVLLENPAIFILDEATASVDPFTETQIQDALDKIIKERTSIIIAHRLWTVRRVDRIIVLDHGKIVEEGNHEELMAKCGIYFKLYNTYFRHQSLEYIEKAKALQNQGT